MEDAEGRTKRLMREARARTDGWARDYLENESFRLKFDELYDAVEAVPTELTDRARSYHYPQLHHACVTGDTEVVRALLAAGTGVDSYTYIKGDEDDTPLTWISKEEELDFKKRVEIANVLIAAGADLNKPIEAAEEADDDAFAQFLRDALESQN